MPHPAVGYSAEPGRVIGSWLRPAIESGRIADSLPMGLVTEPAKTDA